MAYKRINSRYFMADSVEDLQKIVSTDMGMECFVIKEACEYQSTSTGEWIRQVIGQTGSTTDVYTKSEIDAILGISGDSSETSFNARIAQNTEDIAILKGDKNTVGSVEQIAVEAAKKELANLIGAAPEALDSIEEIATFITQQEILVNELNTRVSETEVIVQNLMDADKGILAQAKSYTDQKFSNLPAASADTLGLVKVDNDTIQIDENGVISIKAVSIDLLTGGNDELTIGGGSASD